MKQYKVLPPEQTISNIRNILSGIGILLCEKHLIQDGLCSCRVSIGNNGLLPLDIGTNGKGRSFEYSLASGCAEFMERMQNRLLLNPKKVTAGKVFSSYAFWNEDEVVGDCESDSCNFSYDVNEKEVTPDYFTGDIGEELKKLCKSSSDEDITDVLSKVSDRKTLTAIPFYSVTDKKEVFLPIEYLLMMTGSNGMASGNTPKEAMLQAICEVFERYVMSEIYWKQLTPPTIPLDYFKGSAVYSRILNLKATTNCEVIVKDCSLGRGLPAIGLIIIDRARQQYNFIVGVDCVPGIALERCFTEIHQGLVHFNGLPYKFMDTTPADKGEARRISNNLINIFVGGRGYWPASILQEQSSYEFKGFNRELGMSNTADLNYCMDLVRKLGYNLYIRDNSILGFPTYYVVVPGMSQMHNAEPTPFGDYAESMKHLGDVNRLGRMDDAMAKSLFQGIEENYAMMKEKCFDLQKAFVYNVNKDLKSLSIEMLAALLAYYLEDDAKCLKYLQLHQSENKAGSAYLNACIDYLKLKIAGEDSFQLLFSLYGDGVAQGIISDFSDPKKIFQYYKLPNCPHCASCRLQGDCRVKQIRALNLNISKVEAEHPVQQTRVMHYIESVSD